MIFKNQQRMLQDQIIARGIKDKRVLEAVSSISRELFVPPELQELAYQDSPLPIGYGQTISQPFIVAFMTEAAQLEPNSKVLEIGTGSGYQAAILSKICNEVFTIEVVKPLGEEIKKKFKDLGYHNIHVRIGDGYQGWLEEAPFDAIIVTAAPESIPHTLIGQLKEGGRLIIPVGIPGSQELLRTTCSPQGTIIETLMPVRFVPMVRNNE